MSEQSNNLQRIKYSIIVPETMYRVVHHWSFDYSLKRTHIIDRALREWLGSDDKKSLFRLFQTPKPGDFTHRLYFSVLKEHDAFLYQLARYLNTSKTQCLFTALVDYLEYRSIYSFSSFLCQSLTFNKPLKRLIYQKEAIQ